MMVESLNSFEELRRNVCEHLGFGATSQFSVFEGFCSLQYFGTYIDYDATENYGVDTVAELVLNMYKKELEVKRAIASDIPINTSRDTLLLYLATWQMQPFVQREYLKRVYCLFPTPEKANNQHDRFI
jgi:hypothetical protein